MTPELMPRTGRRLHQTASVPLLDQDMPGKRLACPCELDQWNVTEWSLGLYDQPMDQPLTMMTRHCQDCLLVS